MVTYSVFYKRNEKITLTSHTNVLFFLPNIELEVNGIFLLKIYGIFSLWVMNFLGVSISYINYLMWE